MEYTHWDDTENKFGVLTITVGCFFNPSCLKAILNLYKVFSDLLVTIVWFNPVDSNSTCCYIDGSGNDLHLVGDLSGFYLNNIRVRFSPPVDILRDHLEIVSDASNHITGNCSLQSK